MGRCAPRTRHLPAPGPWAGGMNDGILQGIVLLF